MKLLAHHTLNGHGGMGEGMSMQLARDGRRVLWLAHESAPKNFTGVDVSDPRAPKVIVQTDLPHKNMRSNSLETSGDLMAVACQVTTFGLKPAGFELFDISEPERPRPVSFFDASGPWSRGCHQLWFVDGKTVHMACSDPELKPRNPKDDQVYRIVDVSNPSKPTPVGRWHLPGTMEGDTASAPVRLPAQFDSGFRAHNTNVYPERPDRCYLGYLDGGIMVLDISDRSRPKLVSRWCNSPPYNGFAHTVLPLFGRGLLVVTDESIQDDGADWPKLVWLLDARDETNLVSIGTLPVTGVKPHLRAGGRCGAHNVHENPPTGGAWRSENVVLGTFFNAGVRAYDISDPYAPREVGFFVPPAPPGARGGTIQIND
ncbi:MAG: LVIVD repeat-containing protein, partial [Betaproteobacteria bacterium]